MLCEEFSNLDGEKNWREMKNLDLEFVRMNKTVTIMLIYDMLIML